MGNESKIDLLELESAKNELIERVYNTSSTSLKDFLYYNYFDRIISTQNPNFTEVFLKEFIDDYISTISSYSAFGNNLNFTVKLISQLKHVSSLQVFADNLPVLIPAIERIEHQLNKLDLILNGKKYEDGINHKAFFPLIDKEAPDEFYGIIESVTVRINKTNDDNKFIIVPSEKEIEKKISEQCKTSWHLALELLKKYVKKPYQYHEVMISFDKKEGFFEGNSLGIALTLTFLEELLRFYNPPYVIKIKERTAFTGGVNKAGSVMNIGEEIIKQKVAAIFFSEINSFVIPKPEETYAYFTLTQFKTEYPKRNLKIIPVEDISDVLNRRDLVEIKKINPAVRTGKFVKKNWVGAFVALILTIILSFLFVLDFDDNPALLSCINNTIFVKNRNGKILWNIKANLSTRILNNPDLLKKYARIVDVDDDAVNEIVLNQMLNKNNDITQKAGTINCYDKNKLIKWSYTFQDTVYSEREELRPEYGVMFIDTTTFNNKKMLWCCANNESSFSSAIFSLDLRTGIRSKKTLWNCGHTLDAIIADLNNDEEYEFIGVGIDNGFKNLVIWGVELEKLNGFRPSTEQYRFKYMDEAELLFYIRLPNTDFDNLHRQRSVGMQFGSLVYNEETANIKFVTTSIDGTLTGAKIPSIYYYLSENLKDFSIYIIDEFSVVRDSLVQKRILKPPYTDTKEYKKIIESNILYYKNGEWLKREELN